jgi:hypothetical protein
MLGNLTLKTLSFVAVSPDEGGASVYRETSRGVSTPTELIIRQQEVIESRTKRPAYQTSATVNRWDALADGTIAIVESSTLTVRTIKDTTVSDAELLLGVQILIQLLTGTGADASALDKSSAILITRDK